MGTDFVGTARDQKSCGSCYQVANTEMMEARLKVQQGVDRKLSIQFPLACSFLTEGCHGGWGILSSFWLESFYTVDESCSTYLGKIEEYTGRCERYAGCEPAVKLESPYYIGGHYGGMTEELIMRELRANGPLAIDFMAGSDF